MYDKKAFAYVLRLLSKRDYSTYEIIQKLKKKGFSDESCNATVNELKELNYINDERFCENYVFFKCKKGYGKKRIDYDLKNKMIEGTLILKYLDRINEMDFAKDIFLKRMAILKDKENCIKKLNNFMIRRGFSFDTINTLMVQYKQECV